MTEWLLREVPGERLQAPGHLDRALYVTTPKAWLALLVLFVMVGSVISWAIMGRISTYVKAEGIILSRGGTIVDAASPAGGTLSRVFPAPGASVAEGDLVAVLSDPETMARYESAVSLAERRAGVLRERQAEAEEEKTLAVENIVRHRVRADELERIGHDLVERLERRLKRGEGPLANGVAVDETAMETEQALFAARRSLFEALRRHDGAEAAHLRKMNDLKARIDEAKERRAAAELRVNELASVIEAMQVRAPASGRVIEIRARPGDTLAPGESVLSIETGRKSLDVLFYVSPEEGKRIETGMPVLVTPATVNQEELGSMIGTVESLSEFPVSLAGMEAMLGNRELAMTFARNGPPYTGRVALTPDPATVGGFAWTSPQVSGARISPGTLAAIEVEVTSQPPAALVVPWISESFGL